MQVLIEISALGKSRNCLILCVAAVRIDEENLTKCGSFSSFVRPDDLTLVNWKEDAFLQSIRTNLMDARPIDQVFTELLHWLSHEDFIYCWDYKMAGMIQRLCERCNSKKLEVHTIRNGVLACLNDNHRKKGNPIKLCSARGYNISSSFYDAEKVLKAELILIRKCGMTPAQLSHLSFVNKESDNKNIPDISESSFPLEYSLSSHRKIVHRLGCCKLIQTPEGKKASFQDMRSAVLAGFHSCYFCSPVRKIYKEERTKLLHYSRPHGITVYYHDDAVHIQSRFDIWRAVYDDKEQKLILLHKNTNPANHANKQTPVPGFHVQKCDSTTLKGMLRKIAAHDDFRDQQNKKEVIQKMKPKEVKRRKKKERKREIRRTIALIDELKASGRL